MIDPFSRLTISSDEFYSKLTIADRKQFTGLVIEVERRWFRWMKNGHSHRVNAPAFVWKNPEQVEYWNKGKLHRINGPAIIDYKDKPAFRSYFYHGQKINASSTKEFKSLIQALAFQ